MTWNISGTGVLNYLCSILTTFFYYLQYIDYATSLYRLQILSILTTLILVYWLQHHNEVLAPNKPEKVLICHGVNISFQNTDYSIISAINPHDTPRISIQPFIVCEAKNYIISGNNHDFMREVYRIYSILTTNTIRTIPKSFPNHIRTVLTHNQI